MNENRAEPEGGRAPVHPAILEADLVMRGGVTSGIVYPGAVAEIASQYRLRSIGGTSAGAIAAVISAAAEFGRWSGRRPAAFEEVVRPIPAFLGSKASTGRSVLFHLFTPNPGTRKLFETILALVDAMSQPGLSPFGRIVRALRAVALAMHVPAVLFTAFIVTAVMLCVARTPVGWLEDLALIAASLGVAILLTAGYTSLRLWRWLPAQGKALADNGYGACSTTVSDPRALDPAGTPVPGLSHWMHETIQEAAGLD
jgi:Patatin-like phospholipase